MHSLNKIYRNTIIKISKACNLQIVKLYVNSMLYLHIQTTIISTQNILKYKFD